MREGRPQMDIGFGITIEENEKYVVVKEQDYVIKKFNIKKETCYQDAERFAYDLFFNRQRGQ
jgi:hypothetical protein